MKHSVKRKNSFTSGIERPSGRMTVSMNFGICLDNFSNDFVRRKATFEDLVRMAAKQGYQGIEITPAQIFPSYPEISDGDIEQVRVLLANYQMEPFCWNIYLDTGVVTGRDLSENEIHKAILQNLIYAKKAGFSVIKTSSAITTKILKKIIPLCRDLDMKLAVELDRNSNASNDEAEGECKDDFMDFIYMIQSEGEGQAGVMLDLESIAISNTNITDLIKLSYGIYIRPEVILNHQDFLKTTAQLGYTGYILCREGSKTSLRAQAQAEQFLISCTRIMECNNLLK